MRLLTKSIFSLFSATLHIVASAAAGATIKFIESPRIGVVGEGLNDVIDESLKNAKRVGVKDDDVQFSAFFLIVENHRKKRIWPDPSKFSGIPVERSWRWNFASFRHWAKGHNIFASTFDADARTTWNALGGIALKNADAVIEKFGAAYPGVKWITIDSEQQKLLFPKLSGGGESSASRHIDHALQRGLQLLLVEHRQWTDTLADRILQQPVVRTLSAACEKSKSELQRIVSFTTLKLHDGRRLLLSAAAAPARRRPAPRVDRSFSEALKMLHALHPLPSPASDSSSPEQQLTPPREHVSPKSPIIGSNEKIAVDDGHWHQTTKLKYCVNLSATKPPGYVLPYRLNNGDFFLQINLNGRLDEAGGCTDDVWETFQTDYLRRQT